MDLLKVVFTFRQLLDVIIMADNSFGLNSQLHLAALFKVFTAQGKHAILCNLFYTRMTEKQMFIFLVRADNYVKMLECCQAYGSNMFPPSLLEHRTKLII